MRPLALLTMRLDCNFPSVRSLSFKSLRNLDQCSQLRYRYPNRFFGILKNHPLPRHEAIAGCPRLLRATLITVQVEFLFHHMHGGFTNDN
jgi:hypothetical protein